MTTKRKSCRRCGQGLLSGSGGVCYNCERISREHLRYGKRRGDSRSTYLSKHTGLSGKVETQPEEAVGRTSLDFEESFCVREVLRCLVASLDPDTKESIVNGPLTRPTVKYSLAIALEAVSGSESLVKRSKRSSRKGYTLNVTLELLRRGLSVERIAEKRGFKASTIYGHIEKLLAKEELSLDEVVAQDIQEDIKRAYDSANPLDVQDVQKLMVHSSPLALVALVLGHLDLKLGLGRPISLSEQPLVRESILAGLENSGGRYGKHMFAKILQGAPSMMKETGGNFPFGVLKGYDRCCLVSLLGEMIESGDICELSRKLWPKLP